MWTISQSSTIKWIPIRLTTMLRVMISSPVGARPRNTPVRVPQMVQIVTNRSALSDLFVDRGVAVGKGCDELLSNVANLSTVRITSSERGG
jgi:hypothetical protein